MNVMKKTVDVTIVGAGTADLNAMTQVPEITDNFVLIDGGTLGTTWVRLCSAWACTLPGSTSSITLAASRYLMPPIKYALRPLPVIARLRISRHRNFAFCSPTSPR
jgi:hypothetical protein